MFSTISSSVCGSKRPSLPIRMAKSPLFWVVALIAASVTLSALMGTGRVETTHLNVGIAAGLATSALLLAIYSFKRLRYEVDLIRLIVRRHVWWSEITPNVYLGAIPFEENREALEKAGITHYLSVVEDFEFEPSLVGVPIRHSDPSRWLHLPTSDYCPVSQGDLQRAVSWIDEKTRAGGKVYVHCKGGKGRSAMVVACYLRRHGAEGANSYDYLKSRRAAVSGNSAQRKAIEEFQI